MMNNIVLIDEDKCTGCGICVKMCPMKILYLDPDSGKCRVTDEDKCDRLAGCQAKCLSQAIRIANPRAQ